MKMYIILTVLLAAAVSGEEEHGIHAPSYNTDTFKNAVDSSAHFVMFFAPWCGHCKRLGPTFDELAKKYNEDQGGKDVTIAKVDCTVETGLCSEQGVTGYPTLKFFSSKLDEAQKYRGPRDLPSLDQYIQTTLNPEEVKEEKPQEKAEEAKPAEDAPKGTVVDLTDKTFESHIQRGHHLIKFFAPWCGHCKKLAPIWDDLAKAYADDSSVSISKVDCTQFGAVCSGQGVGGYPTLIFFKDGQKVEQHRGPRDLESLKTFISTQTSKKIVDAERTDEKIPDKQEEKKPEEAPEEEGLVILTTDNMKKKLAEGKALVKFYAPWCGHCKRMAPTWVELAKAFKDNKDVIIAKMDCTEHREACVEQEVRGYPTILYFEDGEKKEKYAEGRELDIFTKYINKKLGQEQEVKEEKEEVQESDNVKELTADNFKEGIAEGLTFVKFFAPWCGHCKSLAPIWVELGDTFKNNNKVTIAKMDCTQHNAVCKEEGVEGFPTLVLYKDGEEMVEHEGGRDLNSLKKFVMDQVPHDEL